MGRGDARSRFPAMRRSMFLHHAVSMDTFSGRTGCETTLVQEPLVHHNVTSIKQSN